MIRDLRRHRTLMIVMSCFSLPCLAQEGQTAESKGPAKEGDPPNITRTQLTQEEVNKQANEVQPTHKLLSFMVGDFEVTSKYWADVKAEPVVSKGRAKGEWLLGGRYVRTDFDGEMSGMPLKGIGIVGYDGADEQYVNLWMDDASTRVVIEKGFYDPAIKQFKYENNNNFYEMGKYGSRTVVVPQDDGTYSVVIYHTYKETPEYKVLQLDFKPLTPPAKTETPTKP